MLPRFRLALDAAILFVLCLSGLLIGRAQAPVALPYTMTTIGGLAPMTAAAGVQCPNLPAGVVSTDAYGDGCLAINGIFGAAAYGGTMVDPHGNVLISDDIKGILHEINASTGIMTLVAGGGTVCSGKLDSSGDGCLAATSTSSAAISNQRSAGIDYYGNPMVGGYSDHLLHMVCLNASPLCVNGTPSPTAANPLQIEVGYMGLVAGCAGNAGGNGSTGTGLDNTPGFSYTTYSLSTFKNSGSCSTSLGEVNKPEGITGDVYGNIYFYDAVSGRWRVVLGPQTSSYFAGSNPLYAVLTQTGSPWTTVTAGYAYTISGLGGSTATTQGSSCGGGGTATDAFGDGCLFTSGVIGTVNYPTGLGVDAAGNMVYTDAKRGLRVFYVSDGTNFAAGSAGYIAGQRMKNAIIANIIGYTGWTTVTAPPAGFNYMLAGGGSTAIGTSTVATLGSQLSFVSDNKMFKLTVSPQGHIYIGDSLSPGRVYFFDINTGYLRNLFTGASSNVAAGNSCGTGTGLTSLSQYSDGCPAANSLFTNTNSQSVAVDAEGNLYMYDGSEPVIRKVLAQGFSPQTITTPGTPLSQSFMLHLPESATASVGGAAAAVSSSPDITAALGTNPSTPACAQNADNTVDCTVTVTTVPTAPGQRSAALTVNLPSGSWENASATIDLGQTVIGSVMAIDSASLGGVGISPSTNALLSGHTPASVAVDGAGNVYEVSGTSILELAGGNTYTLTPSLTAAPSQIAVDPTGSIFAVNSSVASIMELDLSAAGVPATYTTASVAYTPASGTAAPQAIATDRFGNLYVADYQSGGASIYLLSLSPLTQQYQLQQTVASGLQNPVSLAVDASGNLFVADKSAGAVFEYAPGAAAGYSLAKTLTVASPDAVAVDAGGNVYVQSGTTVTEYPVSGPTTAGVTVLTGLGNPVGLAVDGLGNVYSADASNTNITEVVRDAATGNFGTSETTAYAATLTNAGNLATTGSNIMGNVALTGGGGAACVITGNQLGAMNAGQACTISAMMMGAYSSSSSGPLSNTLAFTPTASTLGSLAFIGTLPEGVVYATTTTITGPAESTPTYSASGTEATFTVTVAADVPPSNSVNVTVDSTTTAYPLNSSGVATVALAGLKAGSHTISAQYVVNGFYQGSIATAQNFNIVQASTSVSGWTPGATSQQVSQAIGSGVLNATASTSDTSVGGIAGSFVYTALCTSGATTCTQYSSVAVGIDASTYLPIGTYTLSVSFVPADTIDYAASAVPVTVAGYTVAQATTTAAVGASANVVAADGSGNYTSLSAALAALPATGGTIYLKPGTYTGQNAISYPNVFLRGLGGDPSQVLLTGANGAFASGSVYPGYSLGPAGKGGDEGSAILDVSKNGFMGTTAATSGISPYGFYAEYLTIQNTYNTDATTTTTANTVSANGTCTAGQAAQTLQYLYNNQLQCNSQALALWLNADQAILNNVNLTSLQDTLYAGYQGTSGSNNVPARQYIWKGLITGDVDYIFGDAALVLDHTNIFTAWHGTSATGTETVTAQNKRVQTGSSNDYLSGYVCNACTFMSQTSTANGGAMTKLYFGRPYGVYSTFILLNSYVDQVNPAGWMGWDGATEYLSTSTYGEYNTQAYTDPAVGTSPYPSILFYPTTGAGGVIPSGGNIGYGVTSSSTPAAARESYAFQLTAAQAAQYYPVPFLSTAVSTAGGYNGMPVNWNPVAALTNAVNAFASTGASTSVASGSSVTILGRPQTPGAGLIPSGSYQFMDGSTVLASGTLDASGEAYLTTSSLAAGTHLITLVYGGDSNFAASTSTKPFVLNVTSSTTVTPLITIAPTVGATYGSATNVTVTVAAGSGTTVPTGTLLFTVDNGAAQAVTLNGSGAYSFALSSLAAGTHTFSAIYEGDSNFLGATATGYTTVARAVLQVVANNATIIAGGALPSLTYSITGYVNSENSSVLSGTPVLATAATGAVIGEYPITITTGTLEASNYTFAFTNGYLYVTGMSQVAAVATGDTRTVAEPVFPSVCQQLNADINAVNDDIPASIDGFGTILGNSNLINPTATNPDGGRIQAALNACSASYPGTGAGLAVELSADSAGNNAFLTGPLTMPSNVTLLVDPGVVLFFSRNAQDYDKVPGTHTCGTISTASATKSCQPMIDIPGASTNVGIMGYGKLDGRGGDPLINAVAPYQGYSWWGLSNAYASPDSQQNPRWIQMETGSSNITLYKITLRNAPLFHVATAGAVSNFTAWDIKIVTPTSTRNTDGIDPGNAQNVTITRSWISDGDDNVAVGGSGTTAPAMNISVTNNHFFAGHGQSIGSYTGAGVSNVLWDGNMAAGNGFANSGSASITKTADSNSTGIRIKSANDRGGLVTGIQYSNECILDHKTDIQFTPLYNTNTGTLTPNFNNILIQNVTFLNDASSAGTVQFTGAVNGSVINPLQVTLDNVTFPSALSSSSFVTTGSAGTETNAQLTFGPGAVSSNFITAWAGFAGSNGNTVANNITATSLNPPACSFTYIAPELTGPAGLPQAINYGQNATAVVILTPAVGGAAYPTGTVTLTDALTGNTYSATLPGTTDTLSIPLSGLSVGTHTFTAAYYGDANYVPSTNGAAYSTAGPYLVTVNSGGSLASTTTTLSGVPSSSITYGASFTATATVTGNSPTGMVQFIVNGSAYAAMALTPSTTSGTASATLSLPYSAASYSIYAVYSGDAANAGSISSASTVTVVAASTVTALSAASTTTTLGHPVSMTAMVTSSAGTPVGTVVFSYTTSTNTTAVNVLTTALSNGLASASFNIPDGTDYVTATFIPGTGSYATSASAAMTFTVSLPTPIPLPNTPMALPYTMTTIAGGSTAASANTTCSGTADKYGDGCQATAITINAGDDLRGIAADPFGNIYFTESSANLVRRIAPNGVITAFAGKVSGTACVPTATTGCTPTLVSLSSPRGVNSDAAGNIYISGYSQPKVYKVSVTDGLMYLVAGNGTNGTPTGSNGDGGPAIAANLYQPRGAWVDSVGDLYISDTGDYKVRMVDTNGYIQTVAGNGTSGDSGDGGPATSATLGTTQSVLTDANLNIYIATSSRVRVVCVTCGTGSPLDALLATLGIASPVNGYIYTIAGGAASAYTGTYPTLATNISFLPQKMDIDANGDIYISDGGSGVTAPYSAVWMLDMHTGYIRPVAGNSSSNCSTATDGYGSGCPALQAIIGNAGNGIGVAVDSLGSVYITDGKNQLIRKVTTGLQSSATAVAATTSQPVEFHFVAGDSMASSNSLAYTSTEWNLLSSSPVCTTNGDNTTDCLLTSRFTPSAPGARSTPLTVTSAMGNIAYLGLTGSGTGAASTLDPAGQASFGANLSVAGLAIDKAGNVYLSDAASKNVLRYAPSALTMGASATATTLATLTAPGAIAVDPRGFVFVADTVKGLITQISPAGSTSTLALALAAPAGLAVDSLNNLYVSDSSAKVVYQINPITGAYRKLSLGTLVAPAGLAIGPNGNLLVADPGAPAIDQYNFGTQVLSTISTSATAPSALAVDAAGNLLIADAAQILAVPSSGNSSSFTVASLAPSSLAIDGAGNLYTGSGGSVLELLRTQGYVKFVGASAANQTVSMLNSGNLALTLSSVGQSDTADYSLAATSSTDCTLSGKLPSALAVGGVCSLTAAYTPTTFTTTTDTISFNGNQTTTGLVLTGSVSDFTITAQPATATVVSGGSATYTFTVTPSGGATTFPAAITLSVSGLPSNYTARFSPSSTIAAGAGTSTVTLTIQTVPDSAAVGQISTGAGGNLASRLAPFSLALLLLPFAGKLRKTGKRFSRRISLLLLLIAGLAAVAGVNGCGSNGSSGHAPKSYTVTVTATVGALSHTSNVTLTVK